MYVCLRLVLSVLSYVSSVLRRAASVSTRLQKP